MNAILYIYHSKHGQSADSQGLEKTKQRQFYRAKRLVLFRKHTNIKVGLK